MLKFELISSKEPSVITTVLAFKTPYVLISEALTTLELFKLRDDKYTFAFSLPNTNKDFLESNSNAFNTFTKFLVFGVSKLKSSTITKFLSLESHH